MYSINELFFFLVFPIVQSWKMVPQAEKKRIEIAEKWADGGSLQ